MTHRDTSISLALVINVALVARIAVASPDDNVPWPALHVLPTDYEQRREDAAREYLVTALGAELGMSEDGEIVVRRVAPSLPFAAAGVLAGDVIVGTRPDWAPDRVLSWVSPITVALVADAAVRAQGDSFTFLTRRGNRTSRKRVALKGIKPLSVLPGDSDSWDHAYSELTYKGFLVAIALVRSLLGIATHDDPATDRFEKGYMTVQRVFDGAPASRGGIRKGDRVTRMRLVDTLTGVPSGVWSPVVEDGARTLGRWLPGLPERTQIRVRCASCDDPWPSPVTSQGLEMRYLRDGESKTTTLDLGSSAVITGVALNSSRSVFAIPSPVFPSPSTAESRGLLARYLLLQRGRPSAADDSEERLSGDIAAAVRGGHLSASDRLVAEWLACLTRKQMGEQPNLKLVEGVVSAAFQTYGADRAARLFAGHMKARASIGPGLRLRSAPFSESLDRRAKSFAARAVAFTQNFSEARDPLGHWLALRGVHQLLGEGNELLWRINTNVSREKQVTWLAICQSLWHLERLLAATVRAMPPVRVVVDDASDEVLPDELRTMRTLRDAVIAVLPKGMTSQRTQLDYGAAAYFLTSLPFTWPAARQVLEITEPYKTLRDKTPIVVALQSMRACVLLGRIGAQEREALRLAAEDCRGPGECDSLYLLMAICSRDAEEHARSSSQIRSERLRLHASRFFPKGGAK